MDQSRSNELRIQALARFRRLPTLLLIAAALFFNLKLPVKQLLAWNQSGSDAAIFLNMATTLQPYVPSNSRIGYVTDLPPVVSAPDDLKMIRYALIPSSAVEGVDAPFVVGRYSSLTAARKLLDADSFQLAGTAGSSFFVFRRK